MPEPVWNFHSSLPFFWSKIFRKPSDVPVTSRPPPVVSVPAHSGNCSLCSHSILPVCGLMARSVPTWSSCSFLMRKPWPR